MSIIADVFCSMWDEHSHSWTIVDIEGCLANGPLSGWEEVLLLANDQVDSAWQGSALEALRMCLAIDFSLGKAHPGRSSHTSIGIFRSYTLAHFEKSDLSGLGTPGALLFRWATPQRNDQIAGAFTNVVRLQPDVVDLVDFARMPWTLDCVPDTAATSLVATLPMLEQNGDVRVQAVDDGRAWYRIEPVDASIIGRIPAALDALDASGATVGVLPEESLSQALLEAWIAAVGQRKRPRGSNLAWIVVGTGPLTDEDPPDNTAVIISRRDGTILLKQRKRHRYLLPMSTIAYWGLSLELGDSVDRDEYVTPGQRLCVLESLRGRCVVLVCEDFGRMIPHGHEIAAVAPNLLLVPVLDRELDDTRWQAHAGKGWLDAVGAVAVVSNSLAIPRRMGQAGEVGCLMVIQPLSGVAVGTSPAALQATSQPVDW